VIAMVFDAAALLVLLRGERGHERIAKALEGQVCMTSVSLTAVLMALPEANPRGILEDVAGLGIEVVAVDSNLALMAAKFHAPTASSEVMFALALAKQRGLEVLSGSQDVATLTNSSVKVHSLR
jgi:PIN domain nuclease of toxin-antitoxin system